MLFSRSSGDVSNHFHVDAPTRKADAPRPRLAGKEQALTRIDKGRSTSSVIDEWLSITGNLETDGDVLVNGKIHGDLRCKLLIVGQQAEVEGLVVADEVVVRGVARGVIRANRVRIEKSSRVDSEIFHRALCVEEGAEFVGMSRRSDDPLNELATNDAQAAELRKVAAEMKAADESAASADRDNAKDAAVA
jgi:cytoskeletal protein CcmA (bactofilin family)